MSRQKVKKTWSSRSAFVATPDDLKSLFDAMGYLGNSISILAKCRDKAEREFDKKSLLAYDNYQASEIMGLRIRACKDSSFEETALAYLGYWSEAASDLEGEGPESEVDKVVKAFERRLMEMKPWFSWLARTNLSLIIGLVTTICVGTAIYRFGTTTSLPAGSWMPLGLMTGLVTGMAASFIGWGLNRVWSWFFPVATFAVGTGKARYEWREKMRYFAVFTVVIGNLIGLVWAWASGLFY